MQEVYAGLDLADALGRIIDTYHISDTDRVMFIHTIGDAILGFYPREELLSRLMRNFRLNESDVATITSELEVFINPPKSMSVSSENETPLKPNVPAPENLPTKPAEEPAALTPLTREDVLKALSGSRTMSSDTASLQEKGPQ